MKAKKIKNLARLEWQEHRRRILGSILFVLLISVAGFFLPLIDVRKTEVDLISMHLQQYSALYPTGTEVELRYLILIDFRLAVIVLAAALTSPFLGILDSIGREKESRTIENLLVLPLTDAEIISGKLLACMLAGILTGWFIWLVYFIFILIYAGSAVAFHLLSSSWLAILLLLVPSSALLMNLLGVIIAVQVRKVQTGYNLGFLILLPPALLLTMLSMGMVELTLDNLLPAAGLIILMDGLLFKIAYSIFNRERIILRYK